MIWLLACGGDPPVMADTSPDPPAWESHFWAVSPYAGCTEQQTGTAGTSSARYDEGGLLVEQWPLGSEHYTIERNDAGDPLREVYDSRIAQWTLSYDGLTLARAEIDVDTDGEIDTTIDFTSTEESTLADSGDSVEEWGRFEGVETFREGSDAETASRTDRVIEGRFTTQLLLDLGVDGDRDSRTIYYNDGDGFHVSSVTYDADGVPETEHDYDYDCD